MEINENKILSLKKKKNFFILKMMLFFFLWGMMIALLLIFARREIKGLFILLGTLSSTLLLSILCYELTMNLLPILRKIHFYQELLKKTGKKDLILIKKELKITTYEGIYFHYYEGEISNTSIYLYLDIDESLKENSLYFITSYHNIILKGEVYGEKS